MEENTIGTYNFPDHKRGDTFPSVVFTFTAAGTDLNLSGSNVLVQFRTKDYAPTSLQFTTEDGTIEIQGTNYNQVRLMERSGSAMVLEPGNYFYDMDIQRPNGKNKTYLQGSLKIITDYSRRDG
jgi:hypothetical protein